MTPEPEQFQRLRRMLALKRYELPPPRFFNELPARVRGRICAEALEEARPWWARLWSGSAWRPALSGACALGGVCWVAWKAAIESPGSPPLPARLAQETVAVSGLPAMEGSHSASLLASSLEAGVATTSDSVHPRLGTPAPAWLFKPGWSRVTPARMPVSEAPGPAVRWVPGNGEGYWLLPLSFDPTNSPPAP